MLADLQAYSCIVQSVTFAEAEKSVHVRFETLNSAVK